LLQNVRKNQEFNVAGGGGFSRDIYEAGGREQATRMVLMSRKDILNDVPFPGIPSSVSVQSR